MSDERLGARIHAHRRRLGLTLEELAGRSGVSRSMLSDVERGVKSPTIKVARGIAAGLGCSLSELVAGDDEAQWLVPSAQRPTLVDPRTGIVRQSIAPALLAHGVEVLAFLFPPGSDSTSFPLHAPGTLKTVVVVSGALHARAHDQDHALREGDSLTFPSDAPYLLRNDSNAPCQVHMVILHPRG